MGYLLKKNILLFVIIFEICFANFVWAQTKPYVPEQLEVWREWVTDNNKEFLCPGFYNGSNHHICFIPNKLTLAVDKSKAVFRQKWLVFKPSWVPLPGDDRCWPDQVAIDGNGPVVVIRQKNMPSVFLETGTHTVEGEFFWDKIPDVLSIPEITGVFSLTVNEKKVLTPYVDENSRIWIQKLSSEKKSRKNIINKTNISIFRFFEDTIPFKIHTVVRITASGEKRREKINNVILKGAQPVFIRSDLPVKPSSDKGFFVEIKPGQWNILITSVINREVYEISPVKTSYGSEIWAFKPYPDFRRVEISGGRAIDPAQTTMPVKWRKYSTFLIKPDDTLKFKEIKLKTDGAFFDKFNLNRDIWLDFDGMGATVRDKITGILGKRRFVGIENKYYKIGRVTSDNKDQLITKKDDSLNGICAEKGNIDLTAVLRTSIIKSGSSIPCGWNVGFDTAKGSLHLPTGWQLLKVGGASTTGKSAWVDKWSLLDFFIITVISFCASTVFMWWWGPVFFTGLLLTWHLAYSPQLLWIIPIITTYFRRVVNSSSKSKIYIFWRFIITVCHKGTLVVFFCFVIFFVFLQIKYAFYPQLEPRSEEPGLGFMNGVFLSSSMDEDTADVVMEASAFPEKKKRALSKIRYLQSVQKPVLSYDISLKALVVTQTGSAIPAWNGRVYNLVYDNLLKNTKFKLYLISPLVSCIINLAGSFFVIIMLLKFLKKDVSNSSSKNYSKSLITLFVILWFFFQNPVNVRCENSFPPEKLLNELKSRIQVEPDCFPNCAEISRLDIKIYNKKTDDKTGHIVEIKSMIHAGIKTFVPLCSGDNTFVIDRILLNKNEYENVLKYNNTYWVLVPKGISQITILSNITLNKNLRFIFPIKPKKISVSAPAWEINGLKENGSVDNSLFLTKKAEKLLDSDDISSDISTVFANYLQVERKISTGFKWDIKTIVKPMFYGKREKNIFAAIPLLNNELVKTSGLKIKDNKVLIELSPQKESIEWESSLPTGDTIDLFLELDAAWSEVWSIKAHSFWDYSYEGLDAVCFDNLKGTYWYPRQGDRLKISLKKLKAAPGRSFTIDSVRADYFLKEAYNEYIIKLKIRTSKGRQFEITQPENTILKQIKINNKKLSVTENIKKIKIPLLPGVNSVEILFNESKIWDDSWITKYILPGKKQIPQINFNSELSNIDIFIHMPKNIWVLFTNGPKLGPGVLFWSYIVIIFFISIILSKNKNSPLKAYQWMLLLTGTAALSVICAVFAALWFLAVNMKKQKPAETPLVYNFIQIVLIVCGFFVLTIFYHAVSSGLTGIPEMHVAGNGSYSMLLCWTADRAKNMIPAASVTTYPALTYRIFVLIWSLWLVKSTVKWIRWAADILKKDGGWRKIFIKKREKKTDHGL